jgi:hypothetical protein
MNNNTDNNKQTILNKINIVHDEVYTIATYTRVTDLNIDDLDDITHELTNISKLIIQEVEQLRERLILVIENKGKTNSSFDYTVEEVNYPAKTFKKVIKKLKQN